MGTRGERKVLAFVKEASYMVCTECDSEVFEIEVADDNPNKILAIICANEECGTSWDADTPDGDED